MRHTAWVAGAMAVVVVGLAAGDTPRQSPLPQTLEHQSIFVKAGKHYLNVEQIQFVVQERNSLEVQFHGRKVELEGEDAETLRRWLDTESLLPRGGVIKEGVDINTVPKEVRPPR